MHEKEANANYFSLISLLHQWNLKHLLQHLLAQNITVDVLKMMKIQHIGELLQNFTCGDRIRFEYELEKWRYSIGIPLSTVGRETRLVPPLSTPLIVPSTTVPNRNGKMSESPVTDHCTQTYGPQLQSEPSNYQTPNHIVNHDESFDNTSNQQQNGTALSPTQHQSPQLSPRAESVLVEKDFSISEREKKLISPRVSVSPPSTSRGPYARGRPSSEFLAQQMSIKLDAKEILEKCTPRGPELMKIYAVHKRFRPVERIELINLFAHYFYKHSIHLPVKLCYDLERQILNLFPGEKLKDYRTEKRGKIYIRLSNIKNNRKRSKKLRTTLMKDRQVFKLIDATESKETYIMSEDHTHNFTNNTIPEDTANDCDRAKNNVAIENEAWHSSGGIGDIDMLEEETSNSGDRPLKIYFDKVKQEKDEIEISD